MNKLAIVGCVTVATCALGFVGYKVGDKRIRIKHAESAIDELIEKVGAGGDTTILQKLTAIRDNKSELLKFYDRDGLVGLVKTKLSGTKQKLGKVIKFPSRKVAT